MLQAIVGSSPPAGSGTSAPTCARTKTPVPYVAFTLPGPRRRPRRAPPAGRRSARTGAARPASSDARARRGRRRCRGPRAARPAGRRKLAEPGVEAGRVDPLELGPRGGRGVGGEACAEAVAEERVHRPHPQGASLAGALDLLGVLEQPGELRGGEVGVEGQPARRLDLLLALAEPVEDLLGALVLPDDDRAQRHAGLGIPGEHRLALVVEPAGDDLPGRVGEQLGDGLDDRGEHLLAILLHPPRPGVAVDLVAARLPHRPQPAIEEHRLDPGGALVDAEQQLLGHQAERPGASRG